MDSKNQYDALKMEYNALRSEILQSIAKQHQILIAGYSLAGASFGYLFSKSDSFTYGLAMIPFIFIGMSALWAVECNRMIRASYYIGYVLWSKIQKVTQLPKSIGWETWIRLDKEHKPNDSAIFFEDSQDIFQRYVVLRIPILLSIFSLLSIFLRIPENENVIAYLIISVVTLVTGVLWFYLGKRIRKVSSLKQTSENT